VRLFLARVGTALFVPYQRERLADTLTSVGEAREATGRLDEARACYLEVVRLREQMLGRDSPETNVARSRFKVFLEDHPQARR